MQYQLVVADDEEGRQAQAIVPGADTVSNRSMMHPSQLISRVFRGMRTTSSARPHAGMRVLTSSAPFRKM